MARFISPGKARGSVKQFSGAKKWLNDIDSETASRLITVASDVALVVSDTHKGVIRDVSFGSAELAVELAEKWVGKQWADTVTADSRPKIEALLRESSAKGTPRWRIVTHRSSSGPDLPIMYAAVEMPKRGHVVAFGRSMQPMATLQQQLVNTQQSMEREYLKLRQAEARHRLLFQVASEAVLIVDAASRKNHRGQPRRGARAGRRQQTPGWTIVSGWIRPIQYPVAA